MRSRGGRKDQQPDRPDVAAQHHVGPAAAAPPAPAAPSGAAPADPAGETLGPLGGPARGLGRSAGVGYDPPFDPSGVFDPTSYLPYGQAAPEPVDAVPDRVLPYHYGTVPPGDPDAAAPDRVSGLSESGEGYGPGATTALARPGGADRAAGFAGPAESGPALPLSAAETEIVPNRAQITLSRTRISGPDDEAALERGLRAVRRSADAAADAADAVYGRIQRVTHAEGAGESGLAHVIELHAVLAAGDLMVTLALANSLFFSVGPNEAKSKVALYLVVTMVPFTLLAPLIGPLLDRLRGGRRFAIALTALIRALLCLVMAKTISSGSFAVYPAAFGCLAASRAYGISRSAVIPRVLPPGSTLVRVNSRISMAALAATTVATPIGLGLGKIGTAWTLGAAALFFFLSTWLSLRLPKVVDSNEGEIKAQLRTEEHGETSEIAHTMPSRRLRAVGPSVLLALRTNAALRAYAGFITLFMAFLVRTHPLGGLKGLTAIGAIAVAVAVGNGIGSALGAWLKSRAPEAIVTVAISLSAITAILTAFFYGLPMVLVLSGMAGLAPSLAKLSLDALIQRDTLERVRTSAFAKSETYLQFAWVLGGGLALVLPSDGVLGVSLLAVGLCAMALYVGKLLSDLKWVRSPIPSKT
ncbi:MAG TPA: MFS transporter [Actinocrinis sp.]|nr:MFS transporter [Actinocrinis sp.]